MSKGNGFIQLRRGVFEHVRDGRMSITEALAFIYICSQADTRTGIWSGSAGALSGELGISERTARDVLEKMERGEYIRRFAVPGRHACYPILVHKFQITQGEHNGEQLNALESLGPAELSFLHCEHSVEEDGEHGAAQRIQETREERKLTHTRAPSAPGARAAADLSGFEMVWAAYPKKVARKAAERAWTKVPAGEHPKILSDIAARCGTDGWIRDNGRYIPHFATYLNGQRWKDQLTAEANSAMTHLKPAVVIPRIPTVSDIVPKER
jgi:hypothetical protein